ncbi:serine/arginine-rich splicing factor 7 [Silurus meridionalis]|nr:serine/arginine-rich splicing factor 7 [Silurus meridionalis]
MSRYGRHGGETKVYVGNLGTGAGKGELERAFGYYGPLRTVWIARNPPGFAFVEFDDPRDAEDAVRSLDGKVICGTRVRVELSTGMPRRSRYDRPPTRRPFDPNDRCYECGLVLAHALVEGGILVLALAVGAEAGGRGPSLFDAPALALRKGPGLAHPEGLGLDRDPDLVLALPLIQGAGQVRHQHVQSGNTELGASRQTSASLTRSAADQPTDCARALTLSDSSAFR